METGKNRKRPCCTFCKEPVKNHEGPCGKGCKKRPLISFHDEVEPEQDHIELEVESESEERQLEMQENNDNLNTSAVSQHSNNIVISHSAGTGLQAASTPRCTADVPASSGQAVLSVDVVARLSQQLDRLESRFNDLDARLGASPSQLHIGTTRRVSTRHASGHFSHATELDRSLELAEEPVVIKPVPQRTIPGLKPVPDNADLTSVPSVDGLTEKDIKNALRGEFCYMDCFLGLGYVPVQENRLETAIHDGQVEYKIKNYRRRITDVVTWLEGWFIYEKILTKYHGLDIYDSINEYRELIVDLSKQHPWPAVYVWDLKNRHSHSGKSINFTDFEPTKFATHFINACSRQDGSNCKLCYSHDHITDLCPFRDAPGLSDKVSSRPEYSDPFREPCINFNFKICRYRRCNKAHVCKFCRGPLPNSECKFYGPCANRNRHR